MKKEELLNRLQFYGQELIFEELAPKTISKYTVDVKRFIDSIDHNDDITKNDTLDYKSKLMKLYSARTVNSYIISLNRFLKYTELKDLQLKKLKLQQFYSLGEVIDDNDYKRLMRFAKSSGDIQLYLLMETIKSTGIRISERKYLTAEAIKDKGKSFYIPIRSKGKNRNIIVPQKTVRDLRHYCKKNNIESGQIFSYSYSTIWRHMKKVAGLARVKLEKVYPHSFRHYFAKTFIRVYANNNELADILGHSSTETTRIYTRSTDEEKRHKMEEL